MLAADRSSTLWSLAAMLVGKNRLLSTRRAHVCPTRFAVRFWWPMADASGSKHAIEPDQYRLLAIAYRSVQITTQVRIKRRKRPPDSVPDILKHPSFVEFGTFDAPFALLRTIRNLGSFAAKPHMSLLLRIRKHSGEVDYISMLGVVRIE